MQGHLAAKTLEEGGLCTPDSTPTSTSVTQVDSYIIYLPLAPGTRTTYVLPPEELPSRHRCHHRLYMSYRKAVPSPSQPRICMYIHTLHCGILTQSHVVILNRHELYIGRARSEVLHGNQVRVPWQHSGTHGGALHASRYIGTLIVVRITRGNKRSLTLHVCHA